MVPKGYAQIGGEQTFETEADVTVPDALYIVDEEGNIFALGFKQVPWHAVGVERDAGHYAFNVLRGRVGQNVPPVDTGEFASHIEKRGGKVRIHTFAGWKVWSGNQFL